MDIRNFFSPNSGKKSAASHHNNNNIDERKTKKSSPPQSAKKSKYFSEDSVDGNCNNQQRSRNKSKRRLVSDDDSDTVLIVDDENNKNSSLQSPDSNKEKSSLRKLNNRRKLSKAEDVSKLNERSTMSERKVAEVNGAKKKSRKRNMLESDDEEVVIDETEDPIPEKKERKKTSKKRKSEKIGSDDDAFDEEKKPKKAKIEKKKPKKGTVIYDTDSDEESNQPRQRKPRKKKEIVVLDSDEDCPGPLRSAFAAAPTKSVPTRKTPDKIKGKPVTVMDFFGLSSVHRSDIKTPSKPVEQLSKLEKALAKGKRKQSPQKHYVDKPAAKKSPRKVEDASQQDMSMEMFDDDDFEETLRNIDTEALAQKTASKTGLASRVNLMFAADSPQAKSSGRVLVEDTPQKPDLKPLKKSQPRNEDVVIRKFENSPTKNIRNDSKFLDSDVSPKLKTQCSPTKTPPFSGKKTSPVMKSPVSTPLSVKKFMDSSVNTPSGRKLDKQPSTEERKQGGNPGFWAFKNRPGPAHLGSKEMPQGAENCLEGLTFVVTGVLDSVDRDDVKSLVERHGGKVMTTLSKKTSYIVVGEEAGESKMAKAETLKTKQLDEDGLFALIETLPGKKSKYEIQAENETKKEKLAYVKAKTKSKVPATPPTVSSDSSQKTCSPQVMKKPSDPGIEPTLLWVDKYKPTSLKQVIGQQGDKSNARKLLNWLRGWQKNRGEKHKFGGNRWNDDGSSFKAALLSGPPGIGKTTTATLVCKEAEFSFVELNASDTRSKKSLTEHVATALRTKTLVNYIATGKDESKDRLNHCLVMDEVDGMAGNEDRGGIQELNTLIKNTRIPIICMCNDRAHPKIRSLANNCFDLRFQRPRVEQIKSSVMSIAFKEGLKVAPSALNELIQASNQDVRQVIHNLEMCCVKEKSLDYDRAKKDSSAAKKDLKIGPFEACRLVFSGGDDKSVEDRSRMFFEDYNIMPLFVQENYANVQPFSAGNDLQKHLDVISQAADSICNGDLVERCVRSHGSWNLLPIQAIYSTVIPGTMMRGRMSGMIGFPQWLGKNSTTNKTDRILRELSFHMRLKISADKGSLNMDYRPHLKEALTEPLLGDDSAGVPSVLQLLDDYSLVKDDFDSLVDISQWSTSPDVMSRVLPKVKSAFTRTYNKESHALPYAMTTTVKKSRKGASEFGEDGEEEVVDGAEEGKDDITKDAMIKVKSSKGKKTSDSSQEKKVRKKAVTSTRGKGKGKGK